ncbi:alpha/beta hydrolase [Abyssibius alkaniclasticus]|uniref:alpha/beta hydrolase n=1 Tax=Abyssibius alkaniclasticus TaxID=2881234 RepID=UPI004058B85C
MQPAPYFADLADNSLPVDAAWLTAGDGTRLRRAIWGKAVRGHVLLLPGRTEYIEKYGRVARDLAARGFATVCIDWRGQGLSDHLDGRRDIGHVEDFAEYQDDFQTLLADPAIAALPGPRLMFAHSMGGCIGLRALLNGFKPDAAVFSGPMWGIAINRYVKPIGEVIARAGSKLGKGALRMPGTKAETYVLSDPFEDNLLTGDAEYWAWIKSHTKARPELGLGGPTLRWLDAAREEFARFDAAQMPQTPLLTLLGGDENVVDASAVRRQMARFEKGTLVEIPGARHEIWMEQPELQRQGWDAIDAFLNAQGL